MIERLFGKLTELSRRGFMGKASAAIAAFVSSLAFPRLAHAGITCVPGTFEVHGCCLCKQNCIYPEPCTSPNYCEWHWLTCDTEGTCKIWSCKECYSVGSPCDGQSDCTGNICSKAVEIAQSCTPCHR